MPKVIAPHDLHRDYRGLAELAEDQGWTIMKTNGNHVKFQPPKGQGIITASTPSDHRAVANFKSHLRKAGLKMSTETVAIMTPPRVPSLPIPTVPKASEQESNAAPQQRKKRSYRPGLTEAIHTAIASTPDHSMHVEQARLRLQRTYPGIKTSDLYNSLSKLTSSGHLKRTDPGCYLALTPTGVTEPPTEDESVGEGDVIERFLTVFAELETYLVKMKKRIAQFKKAKNAMNEAEID